MKPRLEIRRADDATVIGYMREDGLYAAVRIADDPTLRRLRDSYGYSRRR